LLPPNAPDSLDAVAIGQAQIHQCNIGIVFAEQSHRFAYSAGLRAHLNPRLQLQDGCDAAARNWMIVYNQNTYD
jgi:hypothetical protein